MILNVIFCESDRGVRILSVLAAILFCLPLPLLADLDEAFNAVHQKDFSKAYQLFLEAAESGNAEAQYNLGVLIQTGQGTEKDLVRARGWFEKSATQGWADAQYQLGNMYEFGQAVQQSYQNAAALYIKAAEQGHASAQTNLAVLYANGQGVNQDIVLAYVWSNLAAAQGVVEALQNREIVAQEMSPEMLQRVRTISREYFQKYVAPFQSEQSQRLVGQPSDPPQKHQ